MTLHKSDFASISTRCRLRACRRQMRENAATGKEDRNVFSTLHFRAKNPFPPSDGLNFSHTTWESKRKSKYNKTNKTLTILLTIRPANPSARTVEPLINAEPLLTKVDEPKQEAWGSRNCFAMLDSDNKCCSFMPQAGLKPILARQLSVTAEI